MRSARATRLTSERSPRDRMHRRIRNRRRIELALEEMVRQHLGEEGRLSSRNQVRGQIPIQK